MIDVEVLIAPFISSSKSTVSRTATPSAPLPLPPVIVTVGAELYPLPGSLTAILTTLPLNIKADANACVPPANCGGPIATEGGVVYPVPPVVMSILLILSPVLLIPTRGKLVASSNWVRRTSRSSAPAPLRIVNSFSPIKAGLPPLIFSLSELI